MSSAPHYPGGTTTPNVPKKPGNRMEAVANFATRAAQTSAQQALNLGATRPGIAKMIAVAGAGVLLIGGGIFAYNSMHQEENAFLSQGEEYARVCQDAKTALRVEDSECEKACVQEPTESPSGSSTESSSSSGSFGSSSSSGSTTTHSNSNAFLWYYLGRQSAANSTGTPWFPVWVPGSPEVVLPDPATAPSTVAFPLRAVALKTPTAARRSPPPSPRAR